VCHDGEQVSARWKSLLRGKNARSVLRVPRFSSAGSSGADISRAKMPGQSEGVPSDEGSGSRGRDSREEKEDIPPVPQGVRSVSNLMALQ